MRLLFKLLATLAFTSLLLAKLGSAQGHPPLVIDRIAFESNSLTKADIKQLTIQLRGRSCSPEEVRSQTIAALHNLGYFRARAKEPKILSKSESSSPAASISIKVTEGARYRIGKFEVVDSTVFSSSRLQGLFPVSDSDWYAVDTIALGLQSLRHLYAHAGYREAIGTPELVVDDAKHTVDVYIHVLEEKHS